MQTDLGASLPVIAPENKLGNVKESILGIFLSTHRRHEVTVEIIRERHNAMDMRKGPS
jgi:hypothetical protein